MPRYQVRFTSAGIQSLAKAYNDASPDRNLRDAVAGTSAALDQLLSVDPDRIGTPIRLGLFRPGRAASFFPLRVEFEVEQTRLTILVHHVALEAKPIVYP
jgi:hypothetical protein